MFHLRPAGPSDVAKIHALIVELAVYELEPNAVEVTIEDLLDDGHGSNPAYAAFVVEDEEHGVFGMALYYHKYSTWKGRCLYLEDLIVTERQRGRGAGLALFEAVAAEAARRGCRRMEWQVLEWNEPSIEFYKGLGAELDATWLNGRLTGDNLAKFSSIE
jgi:GNAT superfamily N-acetyltransferase